MYKGYTYKFETRALVIRKIFYLTQEKVTGTILFGILGMDKLGLPQREVDMISV